jgi:hypothetical protein
VVDGVTLLGAAALVVFVVVVVVGILARVGVEAFVADEDVVESGVGTHSKQARS